MLLRKFWKMLLAADGAILRKDLCIPFDLHWVSSHCTYFEGIMSLNGYTTDYAKQLLGN